MKEVGAFSPRVSSPVLHALVLRDLAEGNEAADTDDVRTQFRMLSCAAASVPTAVAREVLRLGSLRHLVGRLEEHDAVFREGAQIYHRLVVDAFDHASLAARQGVGLENLPAFRKELLQALELGLDSRKVHVRQAVVEAFLAAFSRLESAWPGAGASGPFSILTRYGQHGKFGGHDADDANRVLAQALAIRARCDADIADSGPLLCDFLTQTVAASAEEGIAAEETFGDDVMMLLLQKAESRHEHVRNAVSRALECCFRRRQDRGLEWLLGWVRERYTSALPEAPAAGGRLDQDPDQGKRQMSLPPTREQSLAPGEALRRRLAAQDDSFDREGRTAAIASRQASSLDLSILHAKKAGKQAAAPDTKKHVRAAAMLVLRVWVRSQGEEEARSTAAAGDASQVTASMCRVLEWLLARPSPVADPAASVGCLARAAAVQVGMVAAAVGGQHGALALMGVIQEYLAGESQEVGAGREERAGAVEETEAVLAILPHVAARLPPSDSRVGPVAKRLLSSVAQGVGKARSPEEHVQLAKCLIPLAPSLLACDDLKDGGVPRHQPIAERVEHAGQTPARATPMMQDRAFLLSIMQGPRARPELEESAGGGRAGSGNAGLDRPEHNAQDRLREEMVGALARAESDVEMRARSLAMVAVACGLPGALRTWGLVELVRDWGAAAEACTQKRALALVRAVASLASSVVGGEAYLLALAPTVLVVLGGSMGGKPPSRALGESAGDTLQGVVAAVSGSGARQLVAPLLQTLRESCVWRAREQALRAMGELVRRRPRQLLTDLPVLVSAVSSVIREAHPELAVAAAAVLRRIVALTRCAPIRSMQPTLLSAIAKGDGEGTGGRAPGAVEAVISLEVQHVDAVAVAVLLQLLRLWARDSAPRTRCTAVGVAGALVSRVAPSCAATAVRNVRQVHALAEQRGELLGLLVLGLADAHDATREVAAHALCDVMLAQGGEIAREVQQVVVAALLQENVPLLQRGAAMVLGHLIACLHTAEAELLLSTLGLLPRHEARGAEPPPALAEAATAPAGARQGGGVKVHEEVSLEGPMRCVPHLCELASVERVSAWVPALVASFVCAAGSTRERTREAAADAGDTLARLVARHSAFRATSVAASARGIDAPPEPLAGEMLQGAVAAIEHAFCRGQDGIWRVRLCCLQFLRRLLTEAAGHREGEGDSGRRGRAREAEDWSVGGGGLEELGLNETLGVRVLAHVFLCRFDSQASIAEEARRIWRLSVHHPPKATRLILPVLLRLVTQAYYAAGLGAGAVGASSSSTLGGWRREDKERANACMQYLAERFAGFDGGAALANVFPALLPEVVPCVCNVSDRQTVVGAASVGQEIDAGPWTAAKVEAATALVAASSRAQVAAYQDELLPSVATALADEHLEVRQSAHALLQALQAGAREGHLATRLVAWILSAGGYSALSRFGGDNPEAGDDVLLSGTRRAGTQVGLALVHVADVYGESVLDDVVEGLVEWWEQELRQEETRTDQTSVTEEAAERRAAECVANCVVPLLPALLLPLSQTPNSAARASERLEKLLLALPMSALTKVVVRVTGCMIRAFSDADAVARMAASCSGWAEPCGRAALLGTLHELVVRAGGGVLRVFVPQLTSIYERALGDTHELVRRRAVEAIQGLLPHLTAPEKLQANVAALAEEGDGGAFVGAEEARCVLQMLAPLV